MGRRRRYHCLFAAALLAAVTPSARSDNHVTHAPIGAAYASSESNATAFIHHSILTVGGQQFVTYYNDNQNVTVARRMLGTSTWDVYPTTFTAFNIADSHDVISFGIDGAGYMHLSWGMHGNSLLYAKSTTPVTGSGPMAFSGVIPMTGFENTVTYPQFYGLAGGDLLFLFREGASGDGDTYWNRYDVGSGTWSPVHGGAGQSPFFRGSPWSPDYNLYTNHAAFDSLGRLHLTGTIRYNGDSPAGQSGFQTNHNIFYFRSLDEAVTWERMDGTPYALPISEFGENGDPATAAEIALAIPEGSSLINQCSMTIDNDDRPIFAMYWAPDAASGNHARQYMIGWFDGADWQTSRVTNYATDYDPDGNGINDRIPESQLGAYRMSRPQVLVDADGRVVLIFSDYHRGQVVTAAWSEDRVHWNFVDLTTVDAGLWEPTVDMALWRAENQAHMLYHPMGRGAVQMGEVLEWDAAEFFANPPPPPPPGPQPGDLLLADTFALALGDPGSQSGAFSPTSYATYGPGVNTTQGSLRLNQSAATGSSYVIPTPNFGTADVAAAGGYMLALTDVDPVFGGNGTDQDWLGVSLLRPNSGSSSSPVVLQSPYAMIIRDNGAAQVFEYGSAVFDGPLDLSPPSNYTLRFVVEYLDAAGFGPVRASIYYGLAGEPMSSLTRIDVTTLASVGRSTQYIAIETRNEQSRVGDISIEVLIPGDTDLNKIVDMDDAVALLNAMGGAGDRENGDFTLDSSVDMDDFVLLQAFYGAGG